MDTTRYLDWFKDVQKSHGSVEKTSLAQVGNINARGVFRLGGGNEPGMVRKSSQRWDRGASRGWGGVWGGSIPRKHIFEV